MNWFLTCLTVSTCFFFGAAANAQVPFTGAFPGSTLKVIAPVSQSEEDIGWRERINVNFAPAGISKASPENEFGSSGDFSLKRPTTLPGIARLVFDKGTEIRIAEMDLKRDPPPRQDKFTGDRFQWGPAFRQALLFLAVQHGYAMTQPKTRHSLRGPFFKDYFRSVKSLKGWSDGGRFFTNYVAHPMQGSFMGFIQVQNDPRGRSQTFGKSGEYWKSRMKALAWSAAWSTQFEIGLISQASIGNVGLSGKQTYIDLVVTPTIGTALLISEDILDKYVVRRIEGFSGNFFVKVLSRTLLNPTRTVANIVRLKLPWHRDRGLRF